MLVVVIRLHCVRQVPSGKDCRRTCRPHAPLMRYAHLCLSHLAHTPNRYGCLNLQQLHQHCYPSIRELVSKRETHAPGFYPGRSIRATPGRAARQIISPRGGAPLVDDSHATRSDIYWGIHYRGKDSGHESNQNLCPDERVAKGKIGPWIPLVICVVETGTAAGKVSRR